MFTNLSLIHELHVFFAQRLVPQFGPSRASRERINQRAQRDANALWDDDTFKAAIQPHSHSSFSG